MTKVLHVRLNNLELLHQNGIEQSFFSLSLGQKHYFSSSFDDQTTKMQDDILVQLEPGTVPQSIGLHRWENCMIVFSFEIEIAQLRSRHFTKKRIETKHQEFVCLQFQIYDSKDVLFTNQYVESISQHYLIIEDLFFVNEKHQARAAKQPNYFTIATKYANYVVPLREAVVLVKLPNTIEISSFVNNAFNGKSSVLKHEKLKSQEEISIDKDLRSTGKVALALKWATNLHRSAADQNLLLQSSEVMLYDFQLKFENQTDVVGCRLKITHGSKAFDFVEDIDKSKITKIKKVVFFIVKTEVEEIDFILQKGDKIFNHCRVSTTEISHNSLSVIKKKWVDLSNPSKVLGFIKMRAEKGRNLSVPQANRYWRQVLRRKHNITNMMVSIYQVSAYFSDNTPLTLVAKVQNEEKIQDKITNLNFYDDQDEPSSEVIEFSLKGEQSLYLLLKSDPKSTDFFGIGVVSTSELKLGLNTCEVPVFKNQEKSGTVNCQINKLIFWPFMKPLFQNEPQLNQQTQMLVELFFNNISFTPYFYTYFYDRKQEVYCIVEINKVKKVLFLQNNEHDRLTFFASAGSDSLHYEIDNPDVIKIKISFLVSDLGHEEEIYGTAMCKVKGSEVAQQTVKIKNVQIFNDHSVVLGSVSLQASKSVSTKSPQKNKTAADNEKPSVGSFDLSQASFDTNLLPQKSNSSSRRYSGGNVNGSPKPMIHSYLKKNTGKTNPNEVKLPVIKQKKNKDSFHDLLQMLKVRKRQLGGAYEQKGYAPDKKQGKVQRRQHHSFDLRKLQQSNPNLNRNLQLLFPKRANEKYIQMSRSKHNDYEERMKGLKSVMNEISDIGEIEPSVRESQAEGSHYNEEYHQQPEWEGNQFV